MKRKNALLMLTLLPLAAGCGVDEIFGGDPTGRPIVFTANTGYSNGTETRTEYSGYDELGNVITSTSAWERIDWVDGDLIRIWSGEEVDYGNIQTGGGHASDYVVASHKTGSNKRESLATLKNAGTNGLTWGSDKPHTFFAMYPSSNTEGVDASKVGLDANRFKGTIPARQAVTLKSGSTTFYKPDMNYAYMWAAQKAEAGADVALAFKPLMTAFEFTVGSGEDETMVLNSFTMTSNESPISGDFTASVNADLTGFDLATANTGKTVTVDLGGVTVTKDKPVTFTLFALPNDIDGLTIAFNTAAGVKTLPLKKDGAFVSFPACKKIRITNIGVSGEQWEYYIDDLTDVTVTYLGGDGNFEEAFKSYRYKTSDPDTKEAVPFTLEYSEDGGETWSTEKPAWLTAAPVAGEHAGSTTGESLPVTVAAQENSTPDPHHIELSKASRTKTNFDLSTVNVATGATVARTTANCYVVQGSGTYKFPLVYGNGVANGAVNESAYRAKAGVDATEYRPDEGVDSGITIHDVDGLDMNPNWFLGRFKDHQDQIITSPYIPTQQSGKTLTAVLLWTDVEGLVKDVALTGSGENTYLTFSVPSETITQGNALVAVLADGVIAWSWQIWVTEEDLTNVKEGSNSYQFAPVNIGWCDTMKETYLERTCLVRATQNESGNTKNATVKQTPENLTIYGNNTYFQWGRKDPIQAVINLGVFKTYYPSSEAYAPLSEANNATIGESIQAPFKRYWQKDEVAPYDWCKTHYFNLWNSVVDGYDEEEFSTPVVKTIYDPSPVGYEVPPVAAYSGLTNYTWATINETRGGEFPNGLFLPAVGSYKHYDMEYATSFHTVGFYWTAVSDKNGGFAYNMELRRASVESESVTKLHASSVRPVVDKPTAGTVITAGGQEVFDYEFNGSH